jgi:tetratricopeptide (TPR) repeat protein
MRDAPTRQRAALLLLVGAAVALASAGAAHALYPQPVLEVVPVQRLVENLERLVKKKPKDAQARLNLARVHAMAYASKAEQAQVLKGKEERGAWFGYEPRHAPFAVKPADDAAKRRAAREHLEKAVQRYREAIKLAPDNLTARLGLAWTTEQSGDRKEAARLYRDVIERAWPKEKGMKAAPLGWHSVTAEAADYLTPLLDVTQDAKEIAALKERTAHVRRIPRPVTPIAIPLRDGLRADDLEDRSARVAFDLDGSGLPQRWTWVTRGAGWLVFDRRGTGRVDSGLQLFGNVTFWLFWENGYQALAALDDNGDGVLTGRELRGLAIWQDLNGNGVCDPGELKSLAEWGIVGLSCRYERDPSHPDGMVYAPRGVLLRDGRTRPSFDLILHRR